jgi:cytochrome oxidase Cu insertion factor (SCO1/SenC/PrrC family)
VSDPATTTASPGRRGLWPLWLMVAIFALPAVAAWIFYLNPGLLPATRVNRGELVEPVRPWPAALALTRPDGSAFDATAFGDRWTLVVPSRAPCGAACERRLIDLRQIRLALGESRYVVERLAVLVGDAPAALGEPLAGTQVARAGAGQDPQVQALFGPDPDIWDRIYVVDPFGNLMMRYAADAPPKDVLKDMERLLKASKNWIKGAQYGHR